MKPGKLFLIPNLIAKDTEQQVIPPQVISALKTIRYFLAEDVRSARRYFSSLKIFPSIESLSFNVLDKGTPASRLPDLFKPLKEGHDIGVISEAGCPGVADPGALAVHYAHRHRIPVVPLVGPSSILMALMASGLNGQQFAFHGYLPIHGKDTAKSVLDLEKESRKRNQTQILMETPFRNNHLMKVLTENLNGDTLLCVALDITSPHEKIFTQSIKEWRRNMPQLPKAPAIFLFLAQNQA